MTEHQRHVLSAQDGHDIHVQTWAPSGNAIAVIQLLHGLGEHVDRYARFATAATAHGIAVCTHDHRGHGQHTTHLGHFADKGGWQTLVDDARIVNEYISACFAGQPLVLLGHSMGSYVAQNYAMHYGRELDGLILSASTWSSRPALYAAYMIAKIEYWRRGAHVSSPLLDRLGFGSFNKAFEPARTGLDWLSRDATEVDKYVADPLCGGPYSCGLWLDLIGGLLAITSDNAISQIRADLPILISGGASDPVGGDKGMTRLTMHYAQTGHQRITVKIYAAGRHEMLNETNRDEVTDDWLNWIIAKVVGCKKKPQP